MTYVDLLVLLAIVPLVAVFAVSCSRSMDSASNRVNCAKNLRQIGQALLMYSNENRGNYPRAAYDPMLADSTAPAWGTGTAAPDPFGPGGPNKNDVTAGLFLLLRTQQIAPAAFVCPSSRAVADDFGGGGNTAKGRSNFSDYKKNLSYSYANPYPSVKGVNKGYKLNSAMPADFAVVADINPGTGSGDDVVGANAGNPRPGNSNNHGKEGQNVLYGEGQVQFMTTPLAGVNKDNIYTTKDGKVAASPVDAGDSILLPTDD